jgi:hypothetical protein
MSDPQSNEPTKDDVKQALQDMLRANEPPDIKKLREFFSSAPEFRLAFKRRFSQDFLLACVDDLLISVLSSFERSENPGPLVALAVGALLDTAGVNLPGSETDPLSDNYDPSAKDSSRE